MHRRLSNCFNIVAPRWENLWLSNRVICFFQIQQNTFLDKLDRASKSTGVEKNRIILEKILRKKRGRMLILVLYMAQPIGFREGAMPLEAWTPTKGLAVSCVSDNNLSRFKRSVNPEIVKLACCNFLIITVMYKSIHFWNGNESQNPFLISNFTKIADFFRKWQKNHFFW